MRKQIEINRDLDYIKSNNLEVYAFGCGSMGKGPGFDIVNFLGMRITNYCDNDSGLWGKEIRSGVTCISPEIFRHKKNVACFALVGCTLEEEILNQLKEYGIKIIITYQEICILDAVIERFIEYCSRENVWSGEPEKEELMYRITPVSNPKNKKFAVYTCIAGGYDSVVEPAYPSEDCDYYLISDRNPQNLEIFQWMNLNEIVPEGVEDNFRKNRFCKILGPEIFSEYDYSIYVDGNIKIMGDVRKYAGMTGRSGIAAHELPDLDDLYAHAMVCTIAKFDKRSLVYKQIDDYYKEGMPRHYGMFECTILVRENKNPICRRIMADWWDQVWKRSYRDQLSLTYCLWKNGMTAGDAGVLGKNYRMNADFRRTSEHHRRDRK